MRAYTIGRLARAAGLPTTTRRCYEFSGVLPPPRRTPPGYRSHDDAALARLRFLRAALANGFTTEDTRALLDLRDRPEVRPKAVQARIRARLADLDARAREIAHLRARSSAPRCGRGRQAKAAPAAA